MDLADKEHRDLYQCMNYDLNEDKPLDFDYIIKNFNDQYHLIKNTGSKDMQGTGTNQYVNDIVGMKDKITKKWNVYLMSLNSITMEGNHISGPRVSMCTNNIIMRNSAIDTNFRGCPADKGHGNLPRPRFCAGAGGAHGGNAGRGGALSDKDVYTDKCKAAVP